jgi:hypothetical protein
MMIKYKYARKKSTRIRTRNTALAFVLTCGVLATEVSPHWASAQKCPSDNPPSDVPATLAGTLEYHPGVYAWYGVITPQPVCGEKTIQIGFNENAAYREAHRWVGCEVTVTGKLMIPVTGYWSTPLGLTEASVKPKAGCTAGEAMPNYSKIQIPPAVTKYKVIAEYDPATTIFTAQAIDFPSGKPLEPWQAYTSDMGNGARDLQRIFCADGFVASSPQGEGNAKVSLGSADDMPGAIALELEDNSPRQEVRFTCTRQQIR